IAWQTDTQTTFGASRSDNRGTCSLGFSRHMGHVRADVAPQRRGVLAREPHRGADQRVLLILETVGEPEDRLILLKLDMGHLGRVQHKGVIYPKPARHLRRSFQS